MNTNVQNICNFVPLKDSQDRLMRKFALLFLIFLSLTQCVNDNVNNECFPFINVNETINLDLPQYIDLRVPGGWAYAPGGFQGLIIYNLDGIQFKAFDRLCPGENPSACSQMVVSNSLRILCPCNDNEFNILNGAPLTQGVTCFANEYLVENLNGTILRIQNF